MYTIVYLIRHSEKLDIKLIEKYNEFEPYQISREKRILSANGEYKARILSQQNEFKNLDAIYSSNYVRAIQTAKYFAESQDIKIIVDKGFNERKYGNPEKSNDIGCKQYFDENIKNFEGESRKEVTKRMEMSFQKALEENKGKRIAIFTHGAAMTFLLMKWCELVNVDENKKKTLKFKDKIIIDKVFDAPEVFKLFVNEELNVENIEHLEYVYNE